VPTIGEARRLASLDPTVAEHRNTADVHEWLAPAGLGEGYAALKRKDPAAKAQMAAHVFCVLHRGPAWTAAGSAHEAFIEGIRRAGLLGAAGPVPDDAAIEGVVIFKSAAAEDARRCLAQDPDVASGRLTVEYHQWWSANLVLPW
jgi:uncharacterized protein YciI